MFHSLDPTYWIAMLIDQHFIEKATKNTLGEAMEWAVTRLADHEGRDSITKLASTYAIEEDGNIQYGNGDQYVVFLQREGVRPND